MCFELLQHIIERSKRGNKEKIARSEFFGDVKIKEIYNKITELEFKTENIQEDLEGCRDALKLLGVNLG